MGNANLGSDRLRRNLTNLQKKIDAERIPIQKYRIYVAGDKNVGKTSFIRLMAETYLTSTEMGEVEEHRKRFDGAVLNFCDVPQLGYTEVQHIQECDGLVLVYSITSKESFDKIIEKYNEILRIKNVSSVPVVLIGNKSDLYIERAVSTAQGEELAKQQGWTYFETSTKNIENFNVDLVLSEIKRLLDKI